MLPLLALLAVPVDIVITPLVKAAVGDEEVPLFAVCNSNAPLLPTEPYPDDTKILPPFELKDTPAFNKSAAPEPLLPLPAFK